MGEVERDEADGDVDVKNPAPAVIVGAPAAAAGADRGRDSPGHAVHGEGHAAFGERECVGEDGLLAGLQASAPRALQDAKENQHAEAGSETAQEAAAREKRDAGHIEAFAAHAGGEPGADGKDDGVGDEVAGEHPGGFIGTGAERAGDVGEGDVGDGRVENFHEGGEGDGQGDEPGIVAGAPGGEVEGMIGGYGGSGHQVPWLARADDLLYTCMYVSCKAVKSLSFVLVTSTASLMNADEH